MSNWRTIEHPAILNAERIGYDGFRQPQLAPICPECGAETDTFYCRNGKVVGCDHCVQLADAWDFIAEEIE